MKIELSDGGWAEIRDPRKLTERQAEFAEDAQFELMQIPAVQDILAKRGDGGFEELQELDGAQIAMKIGIPGLKAMRQMRRATVLSYVSAWSLSETIDADAVLDAPVHVVQEIANKVGEIIKATGTVVNTSPSPDPKARTEHSQGSSKPLKVVRSDKI